MSDEFGIDLTLLQVLRRRDRFEALSSVVPMDALDPAVKALLSGYAGFFQSMPGVPLLKPAEFWTFYASGPGRGLKGDALQLHKAVLKRALTETVEPAVEDGIMTRLVSLSTADAASKAAAEYAEGKEVDVAEVLRAAVDRSDQLLAQAAKDPQERTPIEEILAKEEKDWGFTHILPSLNASLRPMTPGENIVISARVNVGKCHALGTRIRMADGSTKAVEDVRVGDVVAGPYRHNTVIATHRGASDLYRVAYPWGESYVVNDLHQVSVQRRHEGTEKHPIGETLAVPAHELARWPAGRMFLYGGWKAGMEYPERDLPVDPYALGVWLADGATSAPAVTTPDAGVLAALTEAWGAPSSIQKAEMTAPTYYFHGVRANLVSLGVLDNKHIPEAYLRASRAQRLQLLAGIIDGYGYNTVDSGYSIVTELDTLKDGYVDLIRGLGMHCTAASVHKRATNSAHYGAWYWQITTSSSVVGAVPVRGCVTWRQGPASSGSMARSSGALRFGITVAPYGFGEYAGIQVDGDHLYLLEDYTVTHNSTYVAQQAVLMAQEVDKLWPGENRSVLWLVNEGTADKMVQRAFQSALRMTPEEMFASVKQPSETHRNKLVELYAKALNGRPGALRVFNAHGMGPGDIMRLVRRYRAGAVIADMVAHLTPPSGGGDMRTDQKLESLWQWFRDAGARHDFVTVGTAQLSADAAGVQWPEMHMMHNVKTGVQGALDTMIAIGMLNDPMMRRFRYVSTPKAKRYRTGAADPRAEVMFSGDRAFYSEATPEASAEED